MKQKLKSNKGFTLLELLICLMIMSIMSVTLMTLYITMTAGFFQDSDKMKVLYDKQRIINLVKKDLIYGTQAQVLSAGAELQLTQPDETVITYAFATNKLNRNGTEILSGLSGVSFQIITDTDNRNEYIELTGTLTGETSETNINFDYVFETFDEKWEFSYLYPDT